jgi:phage/plasmid-associated DNA primase
MSEAVKELEDENNPVNVFFNDHLVVDTAPMTYIEKGSLYDLYKDWSQKTHNYTLSAARFSSCVFRRFHKHTPKQCFHQETKKRIWRNIRYISDPDKEISWQE